MRGGGSVVVVGGADVVAVGTTVVVAAVVAVVAVVAVAIVASGTLVGAVQVGMLVVGPAESSPPPPHPAARTSPATAANPTHARIP